MFGEVKVTKELSPADVTARIAFDPATGRPVLRVLAKGLGIQALELNDAEGELVEVLVRRALGLEPNDAITLRVGAAERVVVLELELEQAQNALAVARSELDARREAAPLRDAVPPPQDLPAMAAAVVDGDLEKADAFVAGVLEHAGAFGEAVAEQVERVCDFAARELAGFVKDLVPPTEPPPPPAPVAPPAPPAARRPVQGRSVDLSPAAKRNLEALEAKKGKPAPAGAEPTDELRAVADRVLRGETLDLVVLSTFVEQCKFTKLDEQLGNAFTEAQELLRGVHGG